MKLVSMQHTQNMQSLKRCPVTHQSLFSHTIIRALRDISHVNGGKLPDSVTVINLMCAGRCLISSVLTYTIHISMFSLSHTHEHTLNQFLNLKILLSFFFLQVLQFLIFFVYSRKYIVHNRI